MVAARELLLADEVESSFDEVSEDGDLPPEPVPSYRGWLLVLASGVVANAVTPTALRLAPSLLLTDDQIDDAVAAIAEVLAAHRTAGATS